MEKKKMREYFVILSSFENDLQDAKRRRNARKRKDRKQAEKDYQETCLSIEDYFKRNPELFELLEPEELKYNIDQKFLENGFTESDFKNSIASLEKNIEAEEQ